MTDHTALIVDDEPHIRELIQMTLEAQGIHCFGAANLAEARSLLEQHGFSFCITDMRLPDGDGLELVNHIQANYPDLPVAVITAHGNVQSAVEALKLGAFDFVQKPVELSVLRALVNTALRLTQVRPQPESDQFQLLGHSALIERVRQLIRKLARSQAPVLISGESGTGKELAARLIHANGPRAEQAFVPVNCGAIPEHLLESEFFGYRKGSFTGANRDKPGLFQAAQGGTLFLDEVGELPAPMQVKLLRAIQERAVRPLGESRETPVDVRILSATNRDLGQLVREARFRQDLYYRLNVIELHMPPLRQRHEDIPELVTAILQRLGGPEPARAQLSEAALQALQGYSFPGNIRELENILERAYTLCEDSTIDRSDLLLPEQPPVTPIAPTPPIGNPPPAAAETGDPALSDAVAVDPTQAGLENYLEGLERAAIMRALEATRYNKTAAAERLGISFRALRYRLKKLGID